MKLWNVKVTVILVVTGALVTAPKRLEKKKTDGTGTHMEYRKVKKDEIVNQCKKHICWEGKKHKIIFEIQTDHQT